MNCWPRSDALLTDLSKAFDCLSHELLLDQLHAYGFSIAALRLIHSYLTNRMQRTKGNLSYSPWEEILFGVQGSILGFIHSPPIKTNRGLTKLKVQINQQLVRFNWALTKEVNMKFLKVLSVCRPLFSEH